MGGLVVLPGVSLGARVRQAKLTVVEVLLLLIPPPIVAVVPRLREPGPPLTPLTYEYNAA